MQVIGFNFTKISSQREREVKNASISTNIQFKDVLKDEVALLKDKETVRVDFGFTIDYNNKDAKEKSKDSKSQAQIEFEGNILLLVSDEESKELLKSWKKKELPQQFKLFLFNFILGKCSIKALSLEEELNLPLHMPLPKLQLQNANPDKK
ncbi:MAG: hypothetical protein AABX11_06185 [Nanoarchaeota archaeon]